MQPTRDGQDSTNGPQAPAAIFSVRRGTVGRDAPQAFPLRRADGTVDALTANLTADVKQVDPGTITPGELAPLKFMLGAVVYYRLQIGGEVIHEIDVENNKIVIAGSDQTAAVRAAIGQ